MRERERRKGRGQGRGQGTDSKAGKETGFSPREVVLLQ